MVRNLAIRVASEFATRFYLVEPAAFTKSEETASVRENSYWGNAKAEGANPVGAAALGLEL